MKIIARVGDQQHTKGQRAFRPMSMQIQTKQAIQAQCAKCTVREYLKYIVHCSSHVWYGHYP